MTMDFGSAGSMRWNLRQDEAEVMIWDEQRPIVCRISRRFIEGLGGPMPDASACLDVAQQQYDFLTDRLGELIYFKCFEPDGTIFLRQSHK